MATLHGVQGSPSESSGDTRRNVSWNLRRRSSRAGALELPASLIHVPIREVPQNGVASLVQGDPDRRITEADSGRPGIECQPSRPADCAEIRRAPRALSQPRGATTLSRRTVLAVGVASPCAGSDSA